MVNKEDIKTLKQPIIDTLNKFDFYKKYANYLESENERLNAIIDKAIEYIKENATYGIEEKCCLDDLNYYECDELLEILGGSNEQ